MRGVVGISRGRGVPRDEGRPITLCTWPTLGHQGLEIRLVIVREVGFKETRVNPVLSAEGIGEIVNRLGFRGGRLV